MSNWVGIVGGGAAGMMAAITAAAQGARVTLIEGNDRLGKKLLSTGNGKCNLGNEKLSLEEYYTNQPELLENCLKRFGTADTIAFFQKMGLCIKNKNGYLYPLGEQAAIVQDVLRYRVRELGVDLVMGCKISKIWKKHGEIFLQGDGKKFGFDRVILACGGQAVPKTGSDGSGYQLAAQLGHHLIPLVPALVQLRCREAYFKAVTGVRAEGKLSVYWRGKCVAGERGELQLTDYGISGIPVFQLSRIINYLLAGKEKFALGGTRGEAEKEPCERNRSSGEEVEVEIDFLPGYSIEAWREFCAERDVLRKERTAEEFFTGILHKKLMLLFIKMAGIKPSDLIAAVEREKIDKVYGLCRCWRVHVTGSNSYENAQVCAGGVPLDEVTSDLESKKVSGVYFAGEILDVDGKCGGYNLQWAWSSGFLSGRASAEAF
ncbi:MAG: aminoacetone oxidase family FAD-binding enzyme [Lachnospiraceae bacterium]|nr:aminoacetone oxidase family FAD-binding enzyme [Lachnospiraceae bacterium]